jgi:hypothetical protein
MGIGTNNQGEFREILFLLRCSLENYSSKSIYSGIFFSLFFTKIIYRVMK